MAQKFYDPREALILKLVVIADISIITHIVYLSDLIAVESVLDALVMVRMAVK